MSRTFQAIKIWSNKEGKTTESFLVEGSTFLVGRSKEAEVFLTEASVSRRHLVVTVQGTNIFLEDQETPGGTRVAGVPLKPHKPTPYVPGDPIHLGKVEYSFHIELLRNHFTEEEIASEFMKQAKRKADALLDVAKREADSVLAHATEEAETLQKKAHLELINFQSDIEDRKTKAEEEWHKELEHLKARDRETLEQAQEAALSDIRNQVESLKQTKLKLESEIASTKTKISSIESEIEAQMEEKRQASLTSIEKEVQALLKKKTELEASLGALSKNKGEQEDRIKSEVEVLKGRLVKDAEESAKAHQKNLESTLLKDWEEKKNQETADHLQKIEKQQQEVLAKKLEEIKNGRHSEIVELKKSIDELRAAKEDIESSRESLKDDLHELEDRKSKAEQSIAELEQTRTQLSSEIDDLRLKEKNQSHQISEVNLLIEKKNEEIQRTSQELATLSGSLESKERELDDLENTSQQMVRAQEEMKKQFEETKSLHLKSIKELEAQKSNISGEYEKEYKRLLGEAESEIQSLKTHAAQELRKRKKKIKELLAEREARLDMEIEELRKNKLRSLDKELTRQEKKFRQDIHIRVSETHNHLINFLERRWHELISLDGFEESKKIISGEIEASLARSFIDEKRKEVTQIQDAFEHDPQRALRKRRIWKKRIAVAIFILSLSATAFLLRENIQQFGQRSQSSTGADQYVDRIKEERSRLYSPPTTTEHKDTYTKNILYTTEFTEIFLGKEFQDKWVIAANDFFVSELGLSDNAIIQFISRENELIQKLKEVRDTIHPDRSTEGIDQLVRIEEDALKDLKILLEGERRFKRFKTFSQKFYDEYVTQLP